MRALFLCACALLVFLSAPVQAEGINSSSSIDEIYKIRNLQRTKYDKISSTVHPKVSEYLDNLFFVTDLIMRENIIMLNALINDVGESHIVKYNKEMENLLKAFRMVKAPTNELEQVKALIHEAVIEQQKFLNDWYLKSASSENQALKTGYAFHPLVKTSHGKLIKAHETLSGLVFEETQENKQAIYDHLCALDFV